MSVSKSSRSYIFVLNNYTPNDEIIIQSIVCEYIVYGREIGESGTPHLQGYIYFKNAKSFSAVLKLFPSKPHIEVAKGNAGQNYDYATKDGDFYENGDKPEQGKRSDIDMMREKLKEKPQMRNVVDTCTSYQALKMAEQILKYKEKPRSWECSVYWFYGETGTGKSKKAFELVDPDDYYVCMPTSKWWDGYDAHSDVIIDDIRSNFSTYSEFLRIIDRYAYKVETKGGTRQLLAKRIFITSPFHPKDIWQNIEDKQQLLRRIKVIKEFIINDENNLEI